MPSDNVYAKIGMRIRELRKERHMTQDDLAHICGCTSNHLSAIENGEHKPSFDLMMNIAATLGETLDYFIADTPHSNSNYFISTRLAPKLDACTSQELLLVERFIDQMLSYKKSIIDSQ
jgi:transcriptional regulator with XRE-family HTH domain